MMLIATRNKGDAKGLSERPLDWLKFSEPTSRTIDPAAKPRTNFVISRYMGSNLLPNSPCLPPGSNTTGSLLPFRYVISQVSANSPTAVATPGKPGNNMHRGYRIL